MSQKKSDRERERVREEKKDEKPKRDVISDGKVLNCTSIYLQIQSVPVAIRFVFFSVHNSSVYFFSSTGARASSRVARTFAIATVAEYKIPTTKIMLNVVYHRILTYSLCRRIENPTICSNL